MEFERFEILTFDCYGTLVDWERGILNALRPLLARHGVESSDEAVLEDYARLESAAEAGPFRPYVDVLRGVVQGLGRTHGFAPDAEELDSLSRSIVDWQPFPDTVPALRVLAGRYRLGILSNVDDDLFAGTAKHLGVSFDTVVTAEQVGSYKPNSANFRALIDRAGVEPAHLLHVAQSLFHDVAPAQELGLATVHVDRRAGARGQGATPASDAVPDLVVRDLRSLVERMGLFGPG